MTTSPQSTITHLGQRPDELPPDSIVFGRTAYMQALRDRIERAAASDMPILLEGESGTGKDILARILHRQSPWKSGVFVKARCSSIPDGLDQLLESSSDMIAAAPEVGAKTLPTACYGTLFLDEISESSPALQTRLLRFLQGGQFCRINLKHCKLNLRLVCATNSGLEEAVDQGRFRRDLLYRINVLPMRVPPLRERMADVPELVNYFLDLLTSGPCDVKRPSKRMLQLLSTYTWPGNIRELENLMKRYLVFGCEEAVCEELLARAPKEATQALSEPGSVRLKDITRKAVRELERDAILKVLQANQWNRKRAACVLNISYRALLYKLKDTGMAADPSASRQAEGRAANTAAV